MENEEFAYSAEVAKGTFWGLMGNAFLKAVSFIYVIYVARAVSQGDLGVFYLALSIVGLVGAWKDFGLPSSLARYVPFFESRKEGAKARSLLAYAFAVNAASGLALTALVWAMADTLGGFFNNAALADALRLISAFMVLENLSKTMTSFLQGRADIKSMQLMNAVQYFFKLVFTVAFFQLYGASLAWLIISFLLSYAASILLFIPTTLKNYSSLHSEGSGLCLRELALEIAPFGLVLSIIQIMSTLIAYSDRVILGYLMAPEIASGVVATYSLAVTLAINIVVFPGAVGGIFMPLISRLAGQKNMGAMRSVMGTAQRWLLFITLPFAVVMIAFSHEMLGAIYGQEYAGGSNAMSIFVLGMFFSFFTQIIALALAGMRMVGLEFRIILVSGILNVALNLLLVPQFGMEGSALASALSFGASALMFSHYGWKLIGFRMPPTAYRMVFAAAATLVLLIVLKPAATSASSFLPRISEEALEVYATKAIQFGFVGVISAFSGAAFVIFCLMLRCFEKGDVAIMKKAASKARVPDNIIAFAEKIVLYGVAAK